MIATGILMVALPSFGGSLPLESVEATFAQYPAELNNVIDGHDVNRQGWSVLPHIDESHSLIVRTGRPIRARSFHLTLSFLSGWPARYPGDFSLSFTSDPEPSLSGNWQPVVVERYDATGPELTLRDNGHFETTNVDDMVGDAIFHIRVGGPSAPVTGFRLDVFPFRRPDIPDEMRVAWGEYLDFCLTEFRVEANRHPSTNIALGRPAKASHPLWANVSAETITDGRPGSFAHPLDPDVGSDFFFEIDLQAVRELDHIGLRSRSDGYATNRMSKIQIDLYDESPGSGKEPVWRALIRPDGSFVPSGDIDIVRAWDGAGRFAGRYVRLSSASNVALSPQFAEVEIYETLTPRLKSIRIDGAGIPTDRPFVAPAGTHRITVDFSVPLAEEFDPPKIRWRLAPSGEWATMENLHVEMIDPHPGEYVLEAQALHSDGEWNARTLEIPFEVAAHFWEYPAFWWGSGSGCLALAFLTAREIRRRREARRLAAIKHESALAEERARIARDMHDEVGARLSQLALMQDLIVREHSLSDDVRRSLGDLAVNTRRTAHALDQVVWAVNPLHDTLPGVVHYLAYEASGYFSPLHIACRLDMPLKWPEVTVRAQVRHQLILAFQESMQNVAKHSGATAVTLAIRYEDPEIVVRLTDNGKGIGEDPDNTPGQDGLGNMRSRMESIGGRCSIDNLPEGGVRVEFRAPLGGTITPA